MNISNTKLTHGLLVEIFKQSLADIFDKSQLDIQTKAVILDCFCTQVQKLSEQQTQRELIEYNTEEERLKKEENQQNESCMEEVSK